MILGWWGLYGADGGWVVLFPAQTAPRERRTVTQLECRRPDGRTDRPGPGAAEANLELSERQPVTAGGGARAGPWEGC